MRRVKSASGKLSIAQSAASILPGQERDNIGKTRFQSSIIVGQPEAVIKEHSTSNNSSSSRSSIIIENHGLRRNSSLRVLSKKIYAESDSQSDEKTPSSISKKIKRPRREETVKKTRPSKRIRRQVRRKVACALPSDDEDQLLRPSISNEKALLPQSQEVKKVIVQPATVPISRRNWVKNQNKPPSDTDSAEKSGNSKNSQPSICKQNKARNGNTNKEHFGNESPETKHIDLLSHYKNLIHLILHRLLNPTSTPPSTLTISSATLASHLSQTATALSSPSWTPLFLNALQHRPSIFIRLSNPRESICDACGAEANLNSTLTFKDRPYNPHNLRFEAQGTDILRYEVDEACRRKAEKCHGLWHWRWMVLQRVKTMLDREGVNSRRERGKRKSMSAAARERHVERFLGVVVGGELVTDGYRRYRNLRRLRA
ncbi:hypothetical protein GLAREA_07999 [Glarea lozoyensis ATCC 20868]|uniref:DUF4211 domain-containing protein n=1 Tax=Glarea lozoyensis (strain ATCC 20868 / MF5171) TaxID=1116229 RepID=S3CFW4_GLAL2|nr:uncharacterized protein GLAREA_07999 [Glarea lozoyensis ATCC 20868]EPE24149.1 hypothetical protein GLAREA_07999 [Glarea lozoyensis ATCC 20868]